MTEPTPIKKARIPNWVKQAVPVLVSVLILYYYFHDQDWGELLEATRQAVLWLAIVAVVIPQTMMWIINTLLTAWTMVWFYGPFSAWKFFWMRGAIFILQMVNNPLAAGGTMLYIQRKTGINWSRLFGIMVFRLGLGIWGFCLLMIPLTLAMHYYGLDEKVKINIWIWWGFLIFNVYWMVEAWVVWHHKKRFGLATFIVRDRESEFWTAFRVATRRQWYILGGIVMPQMLIVFISYYLLALAFDVHIPFWECMVVMPLVLLISNLPIAFGGFGTTTLAWMTFFGDYGTVENIGALTLFIPFARAVFRALVGLISLKPALADLATLSLLSPAAETEEPAAEGE